MSLRTLGFSAAFLTAACGPKITAFDVQPLSLCPNDQVRVTYKVSGAATLMLRQGDPRLAGETDSEELAGVPDTLEFTIVARKGGEEAIRRIAVLQFPESALDEVVFPTRLIGDTLVAAGEKSAARWGDRFQVVTVSAPPGRSLEVRHADRKVMIQGGEASAVLSGTPLEGQWELRSLGLPSELANLTTAPDRLRVDVAIRCRAAR
jgi:hypothetical protein